MDWIEVRNRLQEMVRKYKYVALVLVLGMLLMALPESGETVQQVETVEKAVESPTVAEELEEILAQIEGVGNVRVMLTESSGGETIFQTNEDSSYSGDSQSIRVETVIVSDGDRAEQGMVKQVNPPVWLGAVVVCQGADRPEVQLHIVEAVSNVTGISTDRITVLKMK